MSDKIKHSDLIQPGTFKRLIKDADMLIKKYDVLEKKIDRIIKKTKQLK